jgi:MFS family permease
MLWPGLAALAVPGAAALGLLVVTRRRMPPPAGPARSAAVAEHRTTAGGRLRRLHGGLPAPFLGFAVGTAMCTAGLVTFGLIGYHLAERDLVPTAGVPLLYAAAMAAGAVAALATGEAYDRLGPTVLLALPFLVAAVPALVFTTTLGSVVVGVLVWGAAGGVQDSTVKALVADLVPRERRATAYGIFAGVQGAGALVGGIVVGALYERSLPTLVAVVAVLQFVALLLLVPVARRPAARR